MKRETPSGKMAARLSSLVVAAPVQWPTNPARHHQEARVEKRVPSFRSARVSVAKGREVPCILKDVSARGARMSLAGACSLPPTFAVIIDATGQRMIAELRWRDGDEAGIRWVRG